MIRSKLLLLFIAFQAIAVSVSAQSGYIKVNKQQFVLNNKPYYYVGANYWYGGLLALQKNPKRGTDRIRKELDFLKSRGVTNLRVLVGAEGKGQINGVQRVAPALQPDRGQFNVQLLESLDYLLYEMGKRNMYAVLYLSNNWEWSGGFLQYLNWSKQLDATKMKSKMSWDDIRDITAKFYTCQPCLDDYDKQLTFILNHKNKYTRRSYTNEPAIMAWELANEPRPMRPYATADYKNWIQSTAKRIRSIDKNHLITLGSEGVMGTESMELFKEIHAVKEVDYLTLHIWPKNWSWFRDTSITDSLPRVIARSIEYINQHESIAKELQKPLVIEEFGLPRDNHSFDPATTTSSRDQYFASVFAKWLRSKNTSGGIGGVCFWAFGGTSRPIKNQLFWKPGDDFSGDPPQEEQGLNTVFDSDNSTWKVIRSFTQPSNTITLSK